MARRRREEGNIKTARWNNANNNYIEFQKWKLKELFMMARIQSHKTTSFIVQFYIPSRKSLQNLNSTNNENSTYVFTCHHYG